MFIAALAIATGLYESGQANIFERLITQSMHPDQQRDTLGRLFNLNYFILLFLIFLVRVVVQIVIACYMKLYDLNGHCSPTLPEISREFGKYCVPVVLYMIPVTIVLVIGTLCCVLPGVYLAVVFAPAVSIFVIEDASFLKGIGRCFVLIKENFWMSIGIYIVAFLIYYFSAAIVALFSGLVAGLISYFTTRDLAHTVSWATAVMTIFEYPFLIILTVSVSLQYFNLSELRDGGGLQRRLEAMGQADESAISEEDY